MRNLEIVTFALTFFKKDENGAYIEPGEEMEFSIYVDRDLFDDPKEAAIDHWVENILGHDDFEGLTPKFKTFRVLNSRVPSDLALR